MAPHDPSAGSRSRRPIAAFAAVAAALAAILVIWLRPSARGVGTAPPDSIAMSGEISAAPPHPIEDPRASTDRGALAAAPSSADSAANVPAAPSVPPTPEAIWTARYQGLDKSSLVSRANELDASMSHAIQSEVDVRLGDGRYEVRPIVGAGDPPYREDQIGSGSQLIEGGSEPVQHYVALLDADYPELAAQKREVAWLRAAAKAR